MGAYDGILFEEVSGFLVGSAHKILVTANNLLISGISWVTA
jgi:hypothetical protein